MTEARLLAPSGSMRYRTAQGDACVHHPSRPSCRKRPSLCSPTPRRVGGRP